MLKPSELFGSVSDVAEAIDENINESATTLEEEITHSVSLIDGAFKNIQEQILSSNKKELQPYKNQVLEVYNLVTDISENQLPKYKKLVLQTDLRTESKINDLKTELYETLERRIEETKETIQVFFRDEVKELNKLRADVIAVEEYIKNTPNTIFELREQIFAELRKNTEANDDLIQEKLEKISGEYYVLQEGLLNEPPSTKTSDPLTPLDQNFVTFEQLQQHYKVFVNRVQQQMATVGGGGEVRLEFLDDIDRSTALINGRVLQYDASAGIWTGGIGGGGASSNTLDDTLQLGNTSSLGMSVGFVTATGATFSGNVTIGGTLTYEDVNNVDSIGVITARDGINVLSDGINVVGVSTFTTGVGTVHIGVGGSALLVDGDARVTGILTVGPASISIDGINKKISLGAGCTITGNNNGLEISGIVTATHFVGDGSNITGIATRLGDLVNDSGFITGVSTFSRLYTDLLDAPTGIVTATGIASSEFLIYNGSEYVGVSSTGYRDYVINQGQGYYAYTTDAYTVGVANTTQEILEGEWTLVQPQVASDGLYNQQPECMNVANSGNPWVGSGATIGTGQTEFSLAGTKPGTMCIVRTVLRFEPDTDETDLDMRLHFTTNTATQGTGLTNFNIEKQALVMTVGAAVTYSSEEMISFFVGDTLAGDTKEDAGRFCIQVNGTTDGTFEVLGVTVMIDI